MNRAVSVRFEYTTTELRDLVVIQRLPINDDRGFLARLYCSEEFQKIGLAKPIVQINHTLTRDRGAVRGLHYQKPPHSEAKIVSCLHGEVFDVAVDLRSDSSTFLRWHGEILSEKNGKSLFIPDGFAHGFQTLTVDCELLYFHSEAYMPGAEAGLHPEEPRVAVQWPLPIAVLSARDSNHPPLEDGFIGVRL